MSKLSIGDKVIALTTSGDYQKDWVGEIIEVDNSGVPYRIKYENGEICWGKAENFKLYNGNEQSLTKATITQKAVKLLQASLEDDLGIIKVTIEFDTGLVITLKEKE